MSTIISAKDIQANPNPTAPKRLSKEKREFVDALIVAGGNLSKAATLLGYTGKNPSAHASLIWRSEGVREAYQAELWEMMKRGAGAAINSLIDLAQNAQSENARIAAAKDILDRLAFTPQQTQQGQGHVAVTFNVGTGVQVQAVNATQTIDSTAQEIDLSSDTDLSDGDSTSDNAF